MDNMEKLPIFFVSVKALANMHKNTSEINFSQLGIITSKKICLSQILYTEKKLKMNPYSLYVNKKTYVSKRKIFIEYVINEIIIPKYQLGQSGATLYAIISLIIRFVNWLNDESIEYIDNKIDAKEIFLKFSYYLKTSMRNATLGQATAHTYQRAVLKLLRYITQDKENYISSGIQLITNIRNNKTLKSTDEDREYHFNFYYKLFHQLTDFLLDKKEYPFSINLPCGNIWVLPSTKSFLSNGKITPFAFDTTTGNLRTIDELKKLYSYNNSTAKDSISSFSSNLNKHNTDFRSHKRLLLASTALKAFYMLFLSITGMNDSTAATLPWNNEYEILKENQKFRTIKYRAGNKPIEFQIQNKFIKDFQKFLLLRKYLLSSFDCNFLFFSNYDDKASVSENKIKAGGLSAHINTTMKKNIDKNLPMLSSRILRVNKTHQVIKTNGIIAASQLAQSSIDTIISTYQGESQESTQTQFNTYFKELNKNIFQVENNAVETSVGYCNQPNSPVSKLNFTNNEISCSQREGCLFCEKYAIHADETDIKKILSLQYVINESKYVAKDIAHFHNTYGVVLSRITDILNEIKSLESSLENKCKDIKIDVFKNQNLHPYWEHKLNTLIEMGVLQ